MRLQGCGTALVTPFRPDLTLDEEAIRRLVRRQIEAGVDFLVPCGTTGESPTLEQEERLRVVEIVLEEAQGKVPVLAGAGGYHTGEVVALARGFEALGADGIFGLAGQMGNLPVGKPERLGFGQQFSVHAFQRG